jgi:hypothetical protein
MRQAWFGQLLESALTSTVTGAYADFATIGGRAALQTTAERARIELRDGDQTAIAGQASDRPP